MVLRAVAGWIFGVALLVGSAAAFQPADALRDAGAKMFATTGAVGMVMVVVRGGAAVVHGYGETARASGVAPDGASLVRVGSISKVLATDLMLKLIAEGKLQLSDPVQKFAPRGTSIPGASGHVITLLHLATHTSGLPRALDGAGSPWQRVVHQKLRFTPGSAALYSNGAYDLLGEALAAAGGDRYDGLLRTKVTLPLGMDDTTAAPNSEQCARLMGGSAEDPTTPCSAMVHIAASGGIYSTASDMAIWLHQHLELPHPVYVQRSAMATAEGLDYAGRASGIGLGWIQLAATATSPEIFQKTGALNGFMSYVALAPGRKAGIFIAMTRTDMAVMGTVAKTINELVASL